MPVDYIPVPKEEPNTEEDFPLLPVRAAPSPSLVRWKLALLALSTALLGSMCANVFFVYRQYVKPWELLDALPTQFVGLRRNVPTAIRATGDFDSLNRTVQDAAWENVDMEPWNGFLALDDSYATAQGLPHSQRWPWDSSKGVYIMTSSHELHCVRVLRTLVNEDHDGVPEPERTWHYHHLLHCLNVLRESVMCHADDTPLYIGRLHANVNEQMPRAGTGTVKMCRDWNRLLEWSRARSACYRPVHWNDEDFPEVERYKTCPDGSRPWEGVEDVQD
ncbi:hypothetical protein GGR56DRAFT_648010 [Xylariaceae sp. FL0804]|nr:hypothetical protein GGR56DRAFT_648010 [Xylariaceae sp. FL0804]